MWEELPRQYILIGKEVAVYVDVLIDRYTVELHTVINLNN